MSGSALIDPGQQERASAGFSPICLSSLFTRHRSLRPPIVEGLIRAGEVCNIVAPPKLGKSWLVQSLALAVASGRAWLERFPVHTVPVLHVDNELHPETLAHRFRSLAKAMALEHKSIAGRLFVDSARGRPNLDAATVAGWCRRQDGESVGLVIIDALYRLAVAWGVANENDNAAITGIYNRLDAFARDSGAAVVLVHHTSRGNQAERDVTDTGAGAGAISRAPDNHLVLRRHEEDCAAVLDGEVRSWPSLQPMTLRRHANGLWVPTDLDPTALRGRRQPRSQRPEPEARSITALIDAFIGETPKPLATIEQEAVAAGWSIAAVTRAVRQGKAAKRIHDHRKGRNAASLLSITAPTEGPAGE